MINLKKEGGLVGCFLAKTVRRYKDGESGCIMKKIDAMNYLVFDRNSEGVLLFKRFFDFCCNRW